MTLKSVLLAGAALCAVSVAPAFASKAPAAHVLAANPGAVFNKTIVHHNPAQKVTYTFGVSTGVSVSADYKVKTPLAATYYTWLSSGTICKQPAKEKVTLSTKKTKYAALSTASETISEGCGTPTSFYGDVYDLTKKAKNKTDSFVSTLKATFHNGGTAYKGTLNLDVSVAITP